MKKMYVILSLSKKKKTNWLIKSIYNLRNGLQKVIAIHFHVKWYSNRENSMRNTDRKYQNVTNKDIKIPWDS